MKKKQRAFGAALLTLALLPGHAHANWFRDLFGLKDASEAAGEKVRQGMVELALTARETTNQMGALVSDLNGTDPARAERARKIFEGILGRSVEAGKAPKLSLSLQVVMPEGSPKQALTVDVWPAGTNADEWVTIRFAGGQNTSYIKHPLNATAQQVETPEQLRKRVNAAALRYATRMSAYGKYLKAGPWGNRETECKSGNVMLPEWGGQNVPGVSPVIQSLIQEQYRCEVGLHADEFTAAVMAILPTVREVPAVDIYTYEIPGGFYAAILAEKVDLMKLPAGTKVKAWVHESSSTDARLPPFKTASWEGSVEAWLRRCKDTGSIDVPTVCVHMVDLQLEPLKAYYNNVSATDR